MDRLPYDIWHLIFQYVCTDGGASGCALSLTSKAVRTYSASTRFQSVALASLIQVKNFLICYERIRLRDPLGESTDDSRVGPPVHNLLLSFLPDTCDTPRRTFRPWRDYAHNERSLLIQLANDHKTWVAAKSAWNRDFVLRVSHLLHLAAPTLRTLVVLQCPEIRLPLVRAPDDGFPALRELTLLADDRMFLRLPGPGALVAGQNDPSDFTFYSVPAPFATDGPLPDPEAAGEDGLMVDRAPTFPALTHLHVVLTGPKLHPWDKTLPRWAAIAPGVTHMRISQGTQRVLSALAEMLGVPPALSTPLEAVDAEPVLVDGEPYVPEPVYPSLRTVVVQLSGERKTSNVLDPTWHELERIRDDCAARVWLGEIDAPRVSILRSRAYMDGYWEARLRWDWRDRMLGGGGCWAENEDDENVWKVLGSGQMPGKKGKRKAAVHIREIQPESSTESEGSTAARPAKRWWKVIANGMPRLKRSRSVSNSAAA